MMETIAEGLKLYGVNHLIDECKFEQELCLLLGYASLTHIEHGGIVELTDGGTMTAFHIIGIYLEHRLGEHPCLTCGTDILVAHLG